MAAANDNSFRSQLRELADLDNPSLEEMDTSFLVGVVIHEKDVWPNAGTYNTSGCTSVNGCGVSELYLVFDGKSTLRCLNCNCEYKLFPATIVGWARRTLKHLKAEDGQ